MTGTRDSRRASGRITIVVPVYGDWPSLRVCVDSLLEYASPDDFDVLLVNDCGPEADEIEAGLLGMTFGRTNFRYERNPTNLGFVGTCNRAVFELDDSANDILLLNSDTRLTAGALDEMREVLYLSDRHAVVCPRSNDATIATIPFFRRDRFAERDAERSQQVFDAIADRLPRYYVSPVAIGFCFLIRRSIIDDLGLFDEVYGKGYNEENDFCLRLSAQGYSSLIANHAFVFHVGSTSFGSAQRDELEATNAKVLHSRYPFYPSAVGYFIRNEYSALDRFADLLIDAEGEYRAKVLIDLHDLGSGPEDTVRNAAEFLEFFNSLPQPLPVEITVAASHGSSESLDFARLNLRVLDYDELEEVFDLGVAISPPSTLEGLTVMNRYCLRWLVSGLDTTALRSWERRMQAPQESTILHYTLLFADQVIPLSREGATDALQLFPDIDATSLNARNPTPAELWQTLLRMSASPVDEVALSARDRAVREFTVVSEDPLQTLRESVRELRMIKSSSSFRLARKIAALAGLPRRVRRDIGRRR